MGAHQATAPPTGSSQPRTTVTIPGESPESQVYLAKSVKSGHGFDLNLANLAGKEGDYSSPYNVKARQELREEIGGFDIALRAKQQEKFQTSHNGFNVADTNLRKSRIYPRSRTGGSMHPADETSTGLTGRLKTHNPMKSISGNRAMLQSIGRPLQEFNTIKLVGISDDHLSS
ncbi:hypothetical protein PSTG_11934 [Puccinia striiformis f. sp. tritici PST-78]|uniref:Uncharacterized protein n=2 Tax=Puccinia striiformis f. sp. tritici TaxID=168172 RepID=A0A0L0V643_9BASI|nr:hypothetical protein PSTG_11934 [Puccinia striiformis f. sp. tritici PST-78]